MNTEEKAFVKGKRVECVIGCVLITPAILGSLAFVLCLFGVEWNVSDLDYLSHEWTAMYSDGGGMSAAPIFMGITAAVGAYLIKDSFKYLFIKLSKEDK